jgi:hypothetical protein
MARNRLIKKEFFRDEKVGSLPLGTRLLFISMWIQADDSGNAVADPRLMRAEAFPFDDEISVANVEEWIGLLEKLGMVRRYESSGQRYLNICKFKKHQVINRPSEFRHPRMSTPKGLSESSSTDIGASTEQCGTKGKVKVKVKEKVKVKVKEKVNGKGNGNGKRDVTAVTAPDRPLDSLSERPCARKAKDGWEYTGLVRDRIPERFFDAGCFADVLTESFDKYKAESHDADDAEVCYCWPSDALEEIMGECGTRGIEWPKACKAQKERLLEIEKNWE